MINKNLINKQVINYLSSISCNGIKDGNTDINEFRNKLTQSLFNYIKHTDEDYSDYINFLYYGKPIILRNVFISFLKENPYSIDNDIIKEYGGINNIIKSNHRIHGYRFEEFINDEYMDILLMYMIRNCTFFKQFKFSKNGMLLGNRVINIPKDKIEDYFDYYDGLGIYWSFSKGFAYDNFIGDNMISFSFYAEIPFSSISPYETFEANFGNFSSEEEITLISDSCVEIYKVEITDKESNETWSIPLKQRFICKI